MNDNKSAYRKTILFYLLITIVSLTAHAADNRYERIDSVVQNLMAKYEVVGISVAVVKDNKHTYSHSWGLRDRESSTELKNDDCFRVFSISKSFIATAIMQLLEKRRLNLNDDVSIHLGRQLRNPHFPDIPITIEMLLCHRSSINDTQGYSKSLDILYPEHNADYAQSFNAIQPGSSYQYCNLNYNILGAVIENITGIRFDYYIQTNILFPLGLHGFYDMAESSGHNIAQAYQYSETKRSYVHNSSAYACLSAPYILGESTPLLSPCGGIKMSAVELAEYMRLHMNMGKINGKRLLRKRHERQMWAIRSPENNYGLAFIHYYDIIPEEELIGHRGGGYGINTSMFFCPEKKFGFVILCNGINTSLISHYRFHCTMVRLLYDTIIRT